MSQSTENEEEVEDTKFGQSNLTLRLLFRIKNLETAVKELEEDSKLEKAKTEKRIRALEDWKVAMYAYGTLLGIIISLVSRYFK